MITRIEYAEAILSGLGVKHGWRHRGAKRALVSWMHAETGEHPGLCTGRAGQGARYNPLNTTLYWPGATDYNFAGVKNYETAAEGIAATVTTLKDKRYTKIVEALTTPYVKAVQVNTAIDASTWGSHEPLLSQALSAYQKYRSFFNTYPVGD